MHHNPINLKFHEKEQMIQTQLAYISFYRGDSQKRSTLGWYCEKYSYTWNIGYENQILLTHQRYLFVYSLFTVVSVGL